MSVIDDLELSVRTSNVLRHKGGVNTLDDFMALTQEVVMAQPNAGVRTWKEIQHMQTLLRSPRTAPPIPTASTMTMRDAAALAALQGMLAHGTRYRPRPEDAGLHWHHAVSREAFQIADAFIAARETKET